MNSQELLSLLQQGDETERIEAKQATDQVGKSIQETISAFSNEPGLGGGYVLLGLEKIKDNYAHRYKITGVKDPDKIQCEIVSLCRQNFNVPIRPSFEIILHANGPVVLAYIPEANPHEKPVYILSKGPEKGSYRRIGPSDCLCTREDLSTLYQERSRKQFDETPIEGASKNDLDPAAIDTYRKIRKDLIPSAKELEWDDDDLLIALGALVELQGSLRPTVAGLILFGTEFALKRFLPFETRIDYIIIDGTEWVPRPDRRYHSVEVREALSLAIPRLISLIMRDIPKTFHLNPGDIVRKDIPLIPEVIIREAICNAVMHRDYRSNQIMQILRYTNRIDFRNPGYSLKPVDQLGLPGSIPRNTKIPVVLHDLNFAETKGSGIRTMQEASREANLSVPLFESDRATNTFSLTLLTHHLFDKQDIEWLAQFKDCKLTDDEARTLIVVREMGAITNTDYRNINRVDTLNASTRLRRLRDLGLLEQKGKGNSTYYVPTSKLLTPNITDGTPQISSLPEGLTPQISPLPEGLNSEIHQIGSRTPPESIKRVIKQLCQLHPMKPSQIALLLKRNHRHIRDAYLTSMVESGDLELLFPENPAHPQQAYQAKKSD